MAVSDLQYHTPLYIIQIRINYCCTFTRFILYGTSDKRYYTYACVHYIHVHYYFLALHALAISVENETLRKDRNSSTK